MNWLKDRKFIILLCTCITVLLHNVHSELMGIITDSGTFVSIALLAIDKESK